MAADGFDNKSNVGTNAVGQVAGVFSTRPSAKYVSGARCKLRINGDLVGFAFQISWHINTSAREIMTIDDYIPYELAPQRLTVEGTIGLLHVPGHSVGNLLWQPDSLNFLFQKYISIEVRDTATDNLLFLTDKALITSRAEDIRVDDLASVTLSWRAIGFRDEREPKVADDYREAPAGNAKKLAQGFPAVIEKAFDDAKNKVADFFNDQITG